VKFNRKIYFDTIRPLFGQLSQQQVDGQNYLLDFFETLIIADLRFHAYELATTKHETASTMLPIEEYGKGEGKEYGQPHPETGQTYYGRGDVQLTWYDNYLYAEKQLGLTGENSLVEFPDNALDPKVAAVIMDRGMKEGWFRKGHSLGIYFNETVDDPYNAREIINGDKHIVPNWSNGVSIGNIVKGYHKAFLDALTKSSIVFESSKEQVVRLEITVPKGVRLEVVQK
jgi:hypothetical protein